MATDRLLDAALACVDDFYARMFRNWPDAVTRSGDDFTLSYSGDRHMTGANHLWPHTPAAITPAALRDAEAFFRAFGAAWSVVYTDTYMPGAAAVLAGQHYYARWDAPLMVLDAPPHRLATHPGAVVMRAQTTQHLADVRLVMDEAFATGDGVSQRVVRPEHLDDPTVLHYLAYAGERPAACAMVALHDRMASIWNVGTCYAYRRQRYATTVMHALLDDLRAQGFPVTTLMASPSGQPLYERLGYRQIGTLYYMGPPLIGARPFA